MKILKVNSVLLALLVLLSSKAFCQHDFDHQYEYTNRSIKSFMSAGKVGVELDARESGGTVWLKDQAFSEGIIELDIMGENKPGSNFVGVAFHGVNDSTYDCIYFRPFNFVAEKQINRDHMVQYISMPQYDWYRLRETRTGEFEHEIKNAPDPDKWFHARIEVELNKVSVYVNSEASPSLVVTKLNKRKSGKIGFWAGFNSIGRFANLKITALR
ncbi:hypothetical protein [Chryseosolibacter indicus]|uniref:3-keto-disaccharide hydrolase domain-containing protein n=1 Tax=Chryseosolibacter indicus TaxID=2782351 RepID=A0ABS5VUP1_9BACT|nr:hypothetical protein [Chryseosolibacter indicus]MBT1705051.1 hypothetical protein [Chryseosolibacter indicus]